MIWTFIWSRGILNNLDDKIGTINKIFFGRERGNKIILSQKGLVNSLWSAEAKAGTETSVKVAENFADLWRKT